MTAIPVTTLPLTVIIPSYNGAEYLRRQLPSLIGQQPAPLSIVVIDSSSRDESSHIARSAGCIVEVIPQCEFNHGGTRNRAVSLAPPGTEILVFLTQDALPEDPAFLERLVAPIREGRAWASYARQMAYAGAQPGEVFARLFNYPSVAELRTSADVERLGLKAYFFSNVASAISVEAFRKVGGFPDDVIMNEDMVLCARVLNHGGTVAYCPDAVVRHSHNYTIMQQFRRYFDIGAFLASTTIVSGRSLGHGKRFVFGQLAWCWNHQAKLAIPRCIIESATKFLGINLGQRHRFLPRWLKRRCSMHAFHWLR